MLFNADGRILVGVMEPGANLPREIGKHLGYRGIINGRQLAKRLKIPLEEYLQKYYEKGESPTETILNALAEDEKVTLRDVVDTLWRMARIDAIEIIGQGFPEVMGKFKSCVKSSNVGLINVYMCVNTALDTLKTHHKNHKNT